MLSRCFMNQSILLVIVCVLLNDVVRAQFKFNIDLAKVPENGNYTCDEMVRWLGNEKHYSNDKKDVLFRFLVDDKQCQKQPTVLLKDISFGWPPHNKNRTFFHNPKGTKKCSSHDEYAVAWLSNFSINRNFSHFLHGLLRLFCALVDARLIVWDAKQNKYIEPRKYTIWLDEFFKLTKDKESWLQSFEGATLRSLATSPGKGDCVSSSHLLYGSGCVRLLPPEKWFGYPGCRAGEVLPAFGQYMRQVYTAQGAEALQFVDEQSTTLPGLRVSFAVRDVGATTGMRVVSNLEQVQMLVKRTQHIHSSMENITFEHLDVPSTVRYMAGVHIFVSVHGAGMTNMFFMNRGSAVVEIIPYPLCNCRSPDYFYGTGGYYHGSSIAQGIKHYHYCVPVNEVKWHTKPKDLKPGAKCDWKALHAVESIYVDPTRFVSLMRNVERDLVAAGTIVLTQPIINVAPHANG